MIFSFELSSEGIRTFAKGPEEGVGDATHHCFRESGVQHCAKFEACCTREPGRVAHTIRL